LRLDGGALTVENVPVPRTAFWFPRLAQNARFFEELRSVELLRAFARRLGMGSATARPTNADVPQVVAAVFAQLAKQHRDAGSRLVLVYLAMQEERRSDETAKLRHFVAEEAQRQGAPFFDGVAALREQPEEEVPALFIAETATQFPSAAGHYSVRGNRWVAQWLLASLRERGLLHP
jgi:hypothetical protein